MRSEILIPMIGMTMTEATVVEWLVPQGGRVSAGDPVLTIETDKTTIDIEAEATGEVHHHVEQGVTLAPGEVVGWLVTED
ncbi:MAG: lipoyl domain-containing protein [Phenylobacterium sp.]|nr:lipoyl domain-containing protein [Phenylobacterium sp.]